MRLAIASVANRDDKRGFGRSMRGLIQHLEQKGRSYGIESYAEIFQDNCALLPTGRQNLQDAGIKHGFTHLFCPDNDIIFPPDIIQTFASRNVPVIGANCVCKDPDNLKFTAYSIDPKHKHQRGNRIDSRGKTGIEEVSLIGFGLIMLDLRVMATIPAPHYEIIWMPEEYSTGYQPEDFYCVKKLRTAGISVYVDHDVSQKVVHLGTGGFSLHDYEGKSAQP